MDAGGLHHLTFGVSAVYAQRLEPADRLVCWHGSCVYACSPSPVKASNTLEEI